MELSGTRKKRCTECRCWYEPSCRTIETQQTCGGACRQRRRRRLARRRRWRDVQEARVAERERQRRWRAGQRGRQETESEEKRSVTTGCHAPACDPKYAGLRDKMRESVDRAVELSRAALHRLMPQILEDLARSVAATGTEGRP